MGRLDASRGPSLRSGLRQGRVLAFARCRRSFCIIGTPPSCHAIGPRNVLDFPAAESPGAQRADRHCKNLFPDLPTFSYSNVRCVSATCMLISDRRCRNWISSLPVLADGQERDAALKQGRFSVRMPTRRYRSRSVRRIVGTFSNGIHLQGCRGPRECQLSFSSLVRGWA